MYNFEELRDDHIVNWSALRLPLELARFRSKAEKECLKKTYRKSNKYLLILYLIIE